MYQLSSKSRNSFKLWWKWYGLSESYLFHQQNQYQIIIKKKEWRSRASYPFSAKSSSSEQTVSLDKRHIWKAGRLGISELISSANSSSFTKESSALQIHHQVPGLKAFFICRFQASLIPALQFGSFSSGQSYLCDRRIGNDLSDSRLVNRMIIYAANDEAGSFGGATGERPIRWMVDGGKEQRPLTGVSARSCCWSWSCSSSKAYHSFDSWRAPHASSLGPIGLSS